MSDALTARLSSASLGERFAQEEPITVRIRNILAEYPVSNLIKELLQNADDARATHVKLVIDARTHPTARLIDPKLAAFQGPALLAFNNAPFTESDFANIRRLGASKKRADPGVTGRFGIGFNSVYHVTDLPSFISGTQLAFLDPHELVWRERGIKFDMSSTLSSDTLSDTSSDTCQTLFARYVDQFAGFQTDTLRIDGTQVDGTLFRLPLRSVESRAPFPEISDDDTVSDVTWTTGDLEQLFAKFRQEAHLILLFLRSIEKIDLLIWREGHVSPHVLFSVALADISDADRALRRVIHDSANPLRRFSLNVTISAENHVQHELYRVVTCSQILTSEAAQFIGLSEKEQQKLIPWGGVATRLSPASEARDQSHVFCSLPVTLSGLSVHVNGCFELSASRTALSWHEYARKDAWNRHVLAHVVAPAYAALLGDCQTLRSTAEYYALFPHPQHVLADWERYLCAQLARVLHDEHVIRFKDRWITPKKAIWLGPTVVLGEALRTWLTEIYPLIETPEHVMALFTHVTDLQSIVLTPAALITWLTGHDELLLPLRTNAAVYNQLWQLMFTLPSEEYTKVYDIPLLFTESGKLVRMSAQTEPAYHVIRNARLRQIFAEIRESVIDVSAFSETVLSKLIETRFMNARNIEHVTALDSHLHLVLPPVSNDCKVRARAANSFPSNEWLRGVWQYLVAENCDLSAYRLAPLIPVDGGTGLVPLQHAAHVIQISREIDVPVRALQQLQCHVLDADLQREIAQSRVALCGAEPEHVIQLLAQLHGAQLGGKVTALSSAHKRDLRRYFVRTIKRQWHVTSREHVILKQLAIFELVGSKNSDRFVSLSQCKSRAPVQCHVLDIALPLISCDKDETVFYDSIGLPQISVAELFRAHLFVGEQFTALTPHQQRELLQTLLKTRSLLQSDAEFLELVRNYPCIRCQDGKLRALSCMYDPDNRAVCELLALARDSCPDTAVPLPEQWWQERAAYLSGMRVLGFSHVLHVLDLRALCRSLALMPGPQAVLLATKLFRYVVAQFSELRAQGISLEFLRDMAWLPLYRPVSHVLPPFSELQDNICLVSPLSSQPRARQALVSAVLPLSHVDLPPRDHPFVQYVEWHLPISVSVLVQQLKAVVQLFLALPAKPSAQYLQDLEHVIHEIYSHVDEQLGLSPSLAEVLQRNVSGTEHVIWTGTAFVAPNQVALRCELQIKPWLMKVPKFVTQFKHLTQHVGFMNAFGAEHYCRILAELHAQYGATALSAKHLKQVLKIVRYLSAEIAAHGADHVPADHVLVPNRTGVLKSARSLVYQARDAALDTGAQWTHDLVHAEIAPECCRALGIAPADKLLLQACIKPFGQRQELVHRLKNVLNDYPVASLLPELLQNADDAGATQFTVEYDAEQYPTNQLALPLHALLQSPALVVHNNAPFTESDLRALVLISRGSKQDRADQIGRYGLGFNSVYNVTDAPMLLTRDTLLVFDPQLEYLRGWGSDQEPGICIEFTAPNNHVLNADLLAPFKHLGVDPTRPFNGTIIRLPLRTKKSKLSATICTEDHVLDMFRKFSALGTAPMLFLQHVEQVRVVSRDKLGETQHVQHTVEVNSPTHSRALLAHYAQFRERGGMVAHRLQIRSARAELSRQHRAVQEREEWLVCHQCATSEHVTGKLPVGGVAHCLSDHDKSRAGRLFSFLPLPISLSLPIFVNGYFQLSSARTSLSAHDTWNEQLRDGPIFACYWHVLLQLRKDSPAAYWSVLPQSAHDSNEFWNPLVTRVYQCLAREPSLFVMESHRLVQPHDAIFYQGCEQSRDHVLDDAVRNYLLDVLHVPLVTCPRHVLEEFKRVGVEIAIFSPKVLRAFLKQHVIQLERCGESLQVLQYCLDDLKSASATDLLDLPLLPVKSRALVRFSAKSPCILVHSLNEYELFPPALHARLVDLEAIPRNLVQISRAEMGIIPLSLDVLLDHVSHILPEIYQGQQVITDPAPHVLQWLVHFWHWIRRQCATLPSSVNETDPCEALIDTLCARLADWPVVPTVSGQLVPPNTPLFYQGTLPAEHFELSLAQRLGCQFIDAQRYHVPAEFTQRLYLPNMVNILRYATTYPELIDRFSELSPMERDRALLHVSQFSDSEIDEHCALIRRLPLFPLVHDSPQRLTELALLAAANYSSAHMAPELWTQTRDTLNTCFYTAVTAVGRASAVVLLRDQSLPPVPLHTSVPFMKQQHGRLYKRLGIRAVRTADYLTNHVLPYLSQLDDPDVVLQYVAEHWLTLREFSPLQHVLSKLAFVAHGTGQPSCARDLYDPEHVIYRILFADEPEMFPAPPYTSVTWLQVLRDLGMHVTPSADDVSRAAQLLAEKLSYDHSDAQLLQTLQSFWTFALEERLLQTLGQLSSLKLVVAVWDHRQRAFEGGITRVVVPLRDVGFDLERELIWTQRPIIDSAVFGSTLVNDLFAQHRAMDEHVTPLDCRVVFAHLQTVLKRARTKSRAQDVCGNVLVHEHVVRQYDLEKTLHDIWRFMNHALNELDAEVIAQLQSLPWLLISHQSRAYLATPKNIFAHVSPHLAPLWFALPNLYTTNELADHVTRGVEPSASDARAALRQLHESRTRIAEQSPEGDNAHVTVDLVLELMRLAATTNEPDLELPVLSEDHVLVPVSHVFIRDKHVSQYRLDARVQFLHREVPRDLGRALGVQPFSHVIEERVLSHVVLDESESCPDDELLHSHCELRDMVARTRSPIFADVLVLLLRAQSPSCSELTVTHSVNQLKRLRVVYCSEISTQLIDRRNNAAVSQPRGQVAMVLQQDELFVARKPRCVRWSDLLAQQLNKFLQCPLRDLLALAAVLSCEERDMLACCLALETDPK